eukprot:TRINITY_DN840_c0_g1_i1.p1 TRINITY_DN840_c0_g1~~TRINITY_DN840_c0_g1_i1.p1  ORF type:complete len:214 (+),score=48.26 TRINITY_DN840_c0_g1_i1:99-740(+)
MAAPAAPTGRVPLRVDVWSDVACPWCHVGKARLELSIQNFMQKQSPESMHPYIIDRLTNESGEEYLAYNRRRWGGDGWTEDLRRSGARNGVKFANWKWWPNTLHAHRLIHYAKKFGRGGEMKDRLLRLTYEEGHNISDLSVLLEAGKELGLPNVHSFLESDEGREDVLEEDEHAKKVLGIRGVPYFVFDRKISLSGAQDVAALERCLWQLTHA